MIDTLHKPFLNLVTPEKNLVKERGIHRAMAEMHLAGFTNEAIAAQFEYSANRVSNILRSECIVQYIRERIAENSNDFQAQIQAEGRKAFAKLVSLSQSASSEQVQLGATVRLVDQALGKAPQTNINLSKNVTEMDDEELRKALPELLRGAGAAPIVGVPDPTPIVPHLQHTDPVPEGAFETQPPDITTTTA